jgi:pimeloyl-ACP methyl ester carboxylesterase
MTAPPGAIGTRSRGRMGSWVAIVSLLFIADVQPAETRFVQVAPPQAADSIIFHSVGQKRAVVLIQGLHLHLMRHQNAVRADLRSWQQPGSVLVKTLAHDADVFAFTYGQSMPVTDVADLPALGENIKRLRKAGYREIVLVGFSAGGLVARQFVEDNPEGGVNRVVQVCAPNAGSPMARLRVGVGAVQKPFVVSLTSQSRVQFMEDRRDRRIPPAVDFVCVVGNGLVYSDGLVSTRSQWPDDLQTQGVPAVPFSVEHWHALASEKSAKVIAELVREHQPRWTTGEVAAMRKRLWGEKANP